MNKKLSKLVFLKLIVLIFFLCNCSNPFVSLACKNINRGNIKINDKSLDYFVEKKYGQSSTDTVYFLDLPEGFHRFDIIVSDTISIDTLVLIEGEKYLSINFENGKLTGF